jgi:hypothetical protein
MLASVLRLSGLDQRLAAFKLRLDEKAYEAVDHVKAVVVRMFVVAAPAVAAAGFCAAGHSSPGLWRFSDGWNPPTGYFRRSVSLAVFWQ